MVLLKRFFLVFEPIAASYYPLVRTLEPGGCSVRSRKCEDLKYLHICSSKARG